MRTKNYNDNEIIVKIIDELDYKKNLKSLKIIGEKRNISEIIEYHNDDCQINFSCHPLLKNINTIIAPLRDDFNKDDQLIFMSILKDNSILLPWHLPSYLAERGRDKEEVFLSHK